MRNAFLVMNRLFIIGNGFDLAHGLPTSYKHFIDDYIEELLMKLAKDKIFDDGFILVDFSRDNQPDFKKSFDKIKDLTGIKDYVSRNINYCTISFKNKFFEILLNKCTTENWVDIENVYYVILKEKVKGKNINYPWDAKQLNFEFEQIKNLLEKYLIEKVIEKYQFDFIKNQDIDWVKIYNFLKPISLMSNENNIFNEFIKVEDVDDIKEHFGKERKEEVINNLYFLNFNYTHLSTVYSGVFQKDDKIESKVNFIHGELKNTKDNKVNFGFGDEMDDDYKLIENIDDNEYLKNFKSFQYLQNSNYNDLLRYIDTNKFQVVILGHSCGLSDRTLLNTIFEHTNCRSIKVYYHQKDDGSDNYTEIIQNISRHFNKKKLMREKIVNKTLCKPLPQIQLPLKK